MSDIFIANIWGFLFGFAAGCLLIAPKRIASSKALTLDEERKAVRSAQQILWRVIASGQDPTFEPLATEAGDFLRRIEAHLEERWWSLFNAERNT